jgi:hypothetical protein
MKNFTKQATALMLSGAMVFGSTVSFANNGPIDNDLIKIEKTASLQHELNPVTNSMKVVLGVMMDQSQRVRLEVFNSADQLVHKQSYNDTDGFIQMFDMKALGEGEYFFRITSGNTTYIDKVVVGEKAPSEEAFQAYISNVEENKLRFSYADAKGNVVLSVKDSRGEIIFTESLGKDFSSSGMANLSKLDQGEYTIQLKSSTGKETKQIKIG